MKRERGFTLIELMVVVTVIVILMSIAFKLASMGDAQEKYAVTNRRVQAMNNAISGYYAAFGSYPPVKLHAKRDIFVRADSNGMQDEDGVIESGLKWSNVHAALMAQPVAVEYPFSTASAGRIERVSTRLQERATSGAEVDKDFRKDKFKNGFRPLVTPGAQLAGRQNSTDFNYAPIFKFGVLSYLLPRYLFMTLGDSSLYNLKQWTYNNEPQKKAHSDGRAEYTWENIKDDVQNGFSGRVAMLPSQAACARWMPNLQNIILQGGTFFGVNTSTTKGGLPLTLFHANNPGLKIYCPTKNPSQQYVLDGMWVHDGWGNDLYYYSPQPYQSYKLWSAGPNGKTFPPWVDLSSLEGSARTTAAGWMVDDIY